LAADGGTLEDAPEGEQPSQQCRGNEAAPHDAHRNPAIARRRRRRWQLRSGLARAAEADAAALTPSEPLLVAAEALVRCVLPLQPPFPLPLVVNAGGLRPQASGLAARRGALVTGPAGGGKSACVALVQAAQLSGRPDVVHHLCPAELTAAELTGMTLPSGEWHDGWLSALVREEALACAAQPARRAWLVLDGFHHAGAADGGGGRAAGVTCGPEAALSWLLGDEPRLCLGSGEVLRVPPQLRVLFESDTLAHLAPSDVARGAIVAVPAAPWRAVADAWARGVAARLRAAAQETVQLLALLLPACLQSAREEEPSAALSEADGTRLCLSIYEELLATPAHGGRPLVCEVR
jgi:hypothetical protein